MEEDKLNCLNSLNDVIELETGIPAIKLGLIRYEVKDDILLIYYRPISSYTPQFLVIALGLQIVKSLLNSNCKFKIFLENFYLADEINKRLEEIVSEFK